ncbi:hypothetical protein FS800_23420 [Agrobacterium vitis]|uniref:phage tail terminator protein n=1 Tax=Rhizobium/Agrobacterium group TaxID=227290 RepID=UPI0015723824|nr:MULTISPECIES: hypothetical protein [Rhizobium/Agrobacterium group]MCF1446628.1 hypothetical protein [Allorhizobium ampelinum]MCF1485083.1 hypothetical protein [Allorhizobium ampelinum]NSZ53475.1 hypothetical protein [Agrobacterium vitis]NTA32234.1 hypothetical protein [Agrobacterium vitis]
MIGEIIARLKAETTITDIRPAEDMEALSNGVLPPNRTVFVLPFREAGNPNQFATGGFRQSIDVWIIVAFFIRRYDDAKGGGRVTEFEQIRQEIETALAGWAWDEHEELFELVSSQASAFGKGTTIFAQTWKTTRTLEAS